MAQDYDVTVKLLFHFSRGLVARRLFEAEVVEWINVEQPRVTNLRADLLARLADGSLRHIEIQKRNDPDLGRRQAEYYLGFHRLLGEHVTQVVLYVGREPLRMAPRWQTPSLQFEFTILDIREFDGEPLLASEDWGDNILALLTRMDPERVLERIEAQLRKLRGEEQETAARMLVVISGIIGIEERVVERLHMIDIMENKVLGPAVLRGEATVLKILLEECFGPLPADIVDRVDRASQDEMLRWTRRAPKVRSLDEVFARP